MTRLAIVSDVHADVHALRDALTQAERLDCSQMVCAGDLVDYGLFPEETISLLREVRVPCIRGNHDRWAVGRGRADEPNATESSEPHDATGWDLSDQAIEFLASLPTSWDAIIDGVRVAVRHGTPRSDMDPILPDQATPADVDRWLQEANADVLIVGHTHLHFELRSLSGGMIVNPGALLRDSTVTHPPNTGTFGILELSSRTFTVHRATDGAEVEIVRVTIGVRDRRTVA